MLGKTSHNASVIRCMATLVHTATTNLDVFATAICTTNLYVLKVETNLPNVLYVGAHIQQTTKAARYKVFNKTRKLQLETHGIPQILKNHSFHPITKNPTTEHSSFYKIILNTAEPSRTHTASNSRFNQFISFLNELKSLINPLISLLTTVIDKLISTNGLQ